jgi:hypothetical protein
VIQDFVAVPIEHALPGLLGHGATACGLSTRDTALEAWILHQVGAVGVGAGSWRLGLLGAPTTLVLAMILDALYAANVGLQTQVLASGRGALIGGYFLGGLPLSVGIGIGRPPLPTGIATRVAWVVDLLMAPWIGAKEV